MTRKFASRARALFLGPNPSFYVVAGAVAVSAVLVLLITTGAHDLMAQAFTAVWRFYVSLF